MWPCMIFKRFLEVVKEHAYANFHQAKCSGLWVINSALDLRQFQTSIANKLISGMDNAIDKWKTALSTTIFTHIRQKQLGKL